MWRYKLGSNAIFGEGESGIRYRRMWRYKLGNIADCGEGRSDIAGCNEGAGCIAGYGEGRSGIAKAGETAATLFLARVDPASPESFDNTWVEVLSRR